MSRQNIFFHVRQKAQLTQGLRATAPPLSECVYSFDNANLGENSNL